MGPIWRCKRRCSRQPLRKLMVHCGYEPTANVGIQAQRVTLGKSIKFNFGAKPKPAGRGSEVLAFNGVSSGNGHITGSGQNNCASLVRDQMPESSRELIVSAERATGNIRKPSRRRTKRFRRRSRAHRDLLRQAKTGRPLVRRADCR